ncbi:MAG: branched chain amino acid aminotransferase, partial [Muribaculaceae bacterium]|nr:branched chain amino acid aminotransferase [Muribaculaceae bacterium]
MEKTIDWSKLPFGYFPTDYNVRCSFRNGQWGPIEVTQSDTINVHMAATTLHYGQEIFEGLKAFRGADGKIRIFRMEENAKRMQESAKGLLMEPIPVELFEEMCRQCVKLNERFIPPYGSGASLYIRPLEIGMSPRIGVKEADEYLFVVMCTPVGPYFPTGFGVSNICIMRQYDRVAPQGTGRWKVGGNYAASL